MRRVFPLRPSENCLLVTYDAEGLHDKESKPDKLQSDAFIALDCTTRLRRQNSDVFSSGDENYPATTTKRAAVGKRPSAHLPPRTYAYPVFSGGASLGHPISRSALSLDESQELKRSLSDRERTQRSTSSRVCVSQEGFAKEISSNEVTKRREVPCGNPEHRLPVDTTSRGALRTSSMRLLRAPDSVPRFRSAGGRLVRDSNTVLDGRSYHSRSLSLAASEQSDAKCSDNSSCFTRTTESSSGRSLASDSSYSKKGSISGKSGNGSSPFKHLTARMVAEKLVKVLGKEKLCLPSNRSKTQHASRSIKRDLDCDKKQDCEVPREAMVLSELAFSRETGCRSHHNREASGSIHFPEERWLSATNCDSFTTATVHDNAKDMCKSANASCLIGDPDASVLQNLEARALAREDLAATQDRQSNPWNDKFTQSARQNCRSSIGFSDEIAPQNFDALRFEISGLRSDIRDLALEVAAEIRTRISEKKAAADALRQVKLQMECQILATEKDKASVQESLERELELREEHWALKLNKIQTEERRLRDRVTEMAEDRNELQKVIASFKLKEASWKAQAKESQLSLQTLKERANTSATEVVEMKKSFSDACRKLKAIDGELDSFAQRNKFVEMENKELQKEVLRLQRRCNDQERTIEGLWQELDEAVNSTSQCKSESILRLQRELLRLAGVEQGLRNEMDAMHVEIANLKREKTMAQGGASMNLLNLSTELQGQIDRLQAQAVTLQDENKQLPLNLQTASIAETTQAGMDCKGHPVTLSDLGYEVVNSPCSNEVAEGSQEILESDLNEEGKLFGKVLSGKLHLKDIELQHLDQEIGALMLSRDSLQIEVDGLHGKLVIANQRVRELERQLIKKDEDIEVLQGDLQVCVKELDEVRNELPCTRRQRDEMRKEAEDMSREALRLTWELTELRKVVEKLDEELMLKEGQISILRGAYGNSDI